MADTAPKALQTIAQQLAIATVYGYFLMMPVSLSLLGIFDQYLSLVSPLRESTAAKPGIQE